MDPKSLVEAAERRRLLERELELQTLESLEDVDLVVCAVCGDTLRSDNRSRRCVLHREDHYGRNRVKKPRRTASALEP